MLSFFTSETDLLLDFDDNWHNSIKDMPAPKIIKKYKREVERSGAKRIFIMLKNSVTFFIP